MYITIQKTARGVLEIEERALIELIEFVARTNGTNLNNDNVKATVQIKKDNLIFVTIKIMVIDIDNQVQNEKKLSELIEEAVFQTLQIKPKNISYAYMHAN